MQGCVESRRGFGLVLFRWARCLLGLELELVERSPFGRENFLYQPISFRGFDKRTHGTHPLWGLKKFANVFVFWSVE